MMPLSDENVAIPGWLRRTAMVCIVASGLASAVSSARAGPEPPAAATAAEKVVSELTAAYAKQGGYIATYRSVGEGKSLECTLGSDLATGLGVLHVLAVKGEQKLEARFWSNSDDRMFVAANDERFVIKGMNEELKSLGDLSQALTGQADAKGRGFLFFTPGMLLGKSSIGPEFAFRSEPLPPWDNDVEDAPIQMSDEKSVTFLTKEHGLLTIGRENGMLLRQSLTGENGEARILELKNLQPNPGKEAVLKISAEWPTADAKEQPVVARMAPLRLAKFQSIIDGAERGEVDKGKLDHLLKEQYEALRHFAAACINEAEGSFASKADWPKLFEKTKAIARNKWQEENPAFGATAEAGFVEFLQKPETRLTVRDSIVEGLLEVEETRETATDDIFGRGGWASLKVGNDRAVAAKKSLVDALSRAYFEALVDLKMTKQWDQRDGLD